MEKLAEALLIIDLQKGVCFDDKTIDHFSDLITLVNQRMKLYREQIKPIIFIQHCDEDLVPNSKSWEIVDELERKEHDIIVQKTHANSFYHTNLQALLQQQQITSLEICGAQTQFCVDTTIKFAHGLGYQLTMLKNGSTTYDNEFLSASDTIAFYENIWNRRFLHLIQ
ncbi:MULTISPECIES: cysteine hydrolase family protein [Enterococcus]|uniref:Cysteine hydrolase n=1 Tax=Candidatus Enterococcus murrayae TaxID=2815321 RepID=A0ABS3HE14_9ENTE|nr:cysteine hydrolase family protein [Enterococcus sp. MJM16]MBO0451706.1 cysteine hydrolase [Enterococcus sp. MJM16]